VKRWLATLTVASAVMLFSLAARAAETSTLSFPSSGSGEQIPATLIKPEGAGPFPAIVIVHDCSGLGPRSSGAPTRWADDLVALGYVVIVPDSFSPRGVGAGVCMLPPQEARVANGYVRARDAYGALTALRTLPYVDGKRIGMIGGSHGGWTTLAAISAPQSDSEPLAAEKREGFAAAVALYPSCAVRYGSWSTTRQSGDTGPVAGYSGVYKPIAPVLILIGDADNWTPAEPCRRLVEASRAAGFPMDIRVYPDAHHSFDSPTPVRFDPSRSNNSSPTGKGATTGGNPEAWAAAKKEVASFFGQHLKK
jgi:dienelactone hydrolase